MKQSMNAQRLSVDSLLDGYSFEANSQTPNKK